MFRDEKQRVAVCRGILSWAGLESHWSEDGPSPAALEWSKSNALARGEKVLLLVAFDLWNGEGKVKLDDVFFTLDSGPLTAIGSLLIAFGHPEGVVAAGAAIDEWIADNDKLRESFRRSNLALVEQLAARLSNKQ